MALTIALIVVLLVAAMVLIVVEICTPMFGLLGVAALGCVAWAVYLSYTTHPVFGMVMAVIAIVGFPTYIVLAVKILPGTALGRRLHLGRAPAAPGEGTPEADGLASLLGRTTTAETTLRPSGMIRIDGRRIVAQAESGMIEKGSQVEIVRAAGNRVVVRKLKS